MEDRWMIEEVGIGARDVGKPVLWFTVTDGEGTAALQVLPLSDDRAIALLSAAYEVHGLNGRMCIVERNEHTTRFVRLLKAARV